ncbi:hypothetical protein COO60DRAFT_1480171 [Scenedesmus sp. NREL 46B-D3]|nr:hypothetical protein COO60DRAFT_1480171 [Scenedesmus sp. NREL 46B-D3]
MATSIASAALLRYLGGLKQVQSRLETSNKLFRSKWVGGPAPLPWLRFLTATPCFLSLALSELIVNPFTALTGYVRVPSLIAPVLAGSGKTASSCWMGLLAFALPALALLALLLRILGRGLCGVLWCC